MGSDNIDVGNPTVSRPVAGEAASGPSSEKSPKEKFPKKVLGRICGAMSQQRGDRGHESAPQKFLQLVGYRDPKARPDPWVRPTQPVAIKR